MIRFKTFLLQERKSATSGGQSAGSLELAHISLKEARAFADELFRKHQNMTLDKVIPNFNRNFTLAQNIAGYGKTVRKDMPVIADTQVRAFQRRLKIGTLDINKPLAPGTKKDNPFPEGLTGEQARYFVKNGLRDGLIIDDVIQVREMKGLSAKNLLPIQKQIYFDKCIEPTAKFGLDATIKFLTTSELVASVDHYIIDGHHRWFSALLIDPNMKLRGIMIDLPISKLLPLSKAYGDALGNKRNS